MNLDLEVLAVGCGVENNLLSINYCQLTTLNAFSILYHLVEAFMSQARIKYLFSITKPIILNIHSF